MVKRLELPPGFRFNPTDEELITYYLKPRVLGHELPCNFIETVELYGPKSPWQLFDVNDENSWTDSPQVTSGEKYLYVFTTLTKTRCSDSNKRGSRENTRKKAGCGTWDGQTKRKVIRDHKNNIIGEKRMLVFEINHVGAQFDLDKAGHFRMHEYSFFGVNKGINSAAGEDTVLCKITFSSVKKSVFKLISGSSQDTEPEEILERSGGNIFEGNMNSTSTTMGVAETIEGSECLPAENLDSGVADQFNDWDPSITNWFRGLLDLEGAVEDITQLGKRKIEEESFCRIKKMCF